MAQSYEQKTRLHVVPHIGGIALQARLTLHDLRHTWATLALRAGIHPRVVQERLGHATISITLGTYSHVTAGMGQDAADTVASLIVGQSRTQM